MENNINKKKYNSFNMIKKLMLQILLISLLIITGINNMFADNIILKYDFEEGGGSVAIDGIGNNFNGVIVNADYDLNEKFGSYGLRFDTSNSAEYINTIINAQELQNFCFGTWVYPTQVYEDNVIFDSEYLSTNKIKFYYTNTNTYLQYRDSNSVLRTQTLNGGLAYNSYSHLLLCYNDSSKQYLYYVNGVLSSTNTLTGGGIKHYNNTIIFKIGAGFNTNYQRLKYLDGVVITDFILNQSQITELNTLNTITLPIINNGDDNNTNQTTEGLNNLIEYDIIKSYSPIQNDNSTNYVEYKINNNIMANCDLYIDNKLVKQFYNVLSFNYPKSYSGTLSETYFVYCYFDNGGNRYYELLEPINFNIIKSQEIVNFNVYDSSTNELLTSNEMYIVTPCFKENPLTPWGFNPYTESLNKKNLRYIQKLTNGQASFNLDIMSSHEFCLVRGQLNNLFEGWDNAYTITKIDNQINLGTINIKSPSVTYDLQLGKEDVYKVTEPSFWGKTWESLFALIVCLILAVPIILVGLFTKNGQIVVAGVIIILAGFGVSIGSIVLGVLF